MSGAHSPDANWVVAVLDGLARSAADHPVIIGLLLFGAILSTALHGVTFSAHLILGLSKYLRRQVLEIAELKLLYSDEWAIWRQQTIDIFRFRSMPPGEVDAALKRENLDAARTVDVLAAFSEEWLRKQRSSRTQQSSTAQATHETECPHPDK